MSDPDFGRGIDRDSKIIILCYECRVFGKYRLFHESDNIFNNGVKKFK